MTLESHLESGGTRCPKCGSPAIKAAHPPQMEDKATVSVAMFCATCGARWLNYYTLAKAVDP
ncbi:MAG: hypothetical protein R3297_05400 [Desulfobulbales bacterium]|nr:hypothetical protein [Desulfobulbales bacterium]